MNNRTITAVFRSIGEAEAASRDLAMKVGGVRAALYTSQSEAAELRRLGVADPDRSVLEEALRRGSIVLSASIPEAQFHAAADVIEATGAVDLDEQEAEWRKTGGIDAGTTAANTPVTSSMTTKPTTARAGEVSGSGTPRREPLAGGREETIPLVEEQLRISKRDTAHGRVRVRSYVVETPVQEQVTLHQEHVQIERRPVDRPVEAGAESMFQERTIEATETAEEAVVVKEARTREEVVIRKTADDETRTINDTVRRTEVEVDDDRQKTDPAAKPGSNAARDRSV